ncbi:hypothetical protein [Chryseobacterium lacus]|uniref:hypothetical protein n=1 Tax=Chryseobacterium lacus TaxID=2058346 RepID=UPI0011D13628|nr:hypothetical protein [Chryseobacterium lacus]
MKGGLATATGFAFLLLKPYEKVNFQIPVDFHDLTNNQFNPYGCFFKGEYQASIQNNMSEYLTTSQRKNQKKHQLYSFPIISNQLYLKK